jgi:hypothetical protein
LQVVPRLTGIDVAGADDPAATDAAGDLDVHRAAAGPVLNEPV